MYQKLFVTSNSQKLLITARFTQFMLWSNTDGFLITANTVVTKLPSNITFSSLLLLWVLCVTIWRSQFTEVNPDWGLLHYFWNKKNSCKSILISQIIHWHSLLKSVNCHSNHSENSTAHAELYCEHWRIYQNHLQYSAVVVV